MSIKLYNNQNLYNIANSLREVTLNNDTYNIKEMSQVLITYFQTYQAYIDGTLGEYNFQSMNPNITNIGEHAFSHCTNLALTSLPENITEIGHYAFDNCTNLALTKLPENIENIGDQAFAHCKNLKFLTFKGTPQTIANNAFYNCNNLTTINVPWSEGEVANAPWGAYNATINYNYTGEQKI